MRAGVTYVSSGVSTTGMSQHTQRTSLVRLRTSGVAHLLMHSRCWVVDILSCPFYLRHVSASMAHPCSMWVASAWLTRLDSAILRRKSSDSPGEVGSSLWLMWFMLQCIADDVYAVDCSGLMPIYGTDGIEYYFWRGVI